MNPETDEIARLIRTSTHVAPPDGAMTDRARLALIEHISAEPETARFGQRLVRRRAAWWSAAGAGALAVAAAVLVAANGFPAKTASSPGKLALTPKHTPEATGPSTPVVHGSLVLQHLAQSLAASPALPGNATLVVHHNVIGGPNPSSTSGDDLYEDNGSYYYGDDLTDLRASLNDPSDADVSQGKVIAAAAASANATPTQAAEAVYNAAPVPAPATTTTTVTQSAPQDALPPHPVHPTTPATQAERDNYLWMNIGTALEGGSGQPAVRAGALLAASVLPDVQVTSTTLDGTPVIQLTNTEFAGNYSETYDIDAQTAVLIYFHGGTTGTTTDGVSISYQVSRVTTPNLDPAH